MLFFVFFLNLSLYMRVGKKTAHSDVFINVLPMLHTKENGPLMCDVLTCEPKLKQKSDLSFITTHM